MPLVMYLPEGQKTLHHVNITLYSYEEEELVG